MAQMSDPKDVSAEATEGESIAIDDMRLWKVVAVVGSGYDMLLVVGLYSCVSRCSCGSVGICPLKGYNLQFWYKSKMLHCGWILHFTIKALFNLNLAPHSFRFQQYTLKICTFAVEQAAAFAVERAAASAVEWAAASAVEGAAASVTWAVASVAWVVASTTGCDVHVGWAGVDMFAIVDAAAGPALAAVSVLAV